MLKINIKNCTSKYIIIKPLKTKDKEKNIESRKSLPGGKTIGIQEDYSSENSGGQKEETQYFWNAERKICQSRFLYTMQISFKNEAEIKTCSDEEK